MKTLFLAVIMLVAGGCACWTDQSKVNTPACVVAHDVVNCTESAVESVVPYFVQIVGGLLSGGVDPNNIPWDSIETQAESMGIQDGGCFLAELKQLLFGKPGASPALMAQAHRMSDALTTYKLKKFGKATVQFKIKADGKEVVL